MAMKAMAATKTMKDAKAMKAAKCSNAMKVAECSKAMNALKATKCSNAAECSKDAKKMKPTESSRAREDEARKCSRTLGNFLKSLLEHPKFCGYESVEKIKDPTDHVETLGATITDATTEWEVIPLQVFFKNGQPREVEVLWLEKEQCRCLPRRTLLVL